MKYAIVETGGKQFRAVEGGTIEVDRLPVESGAKLKLEQVLLVADGEDITVGTPIVKNSPIWTTVLEHFKGPKVTIFNYRPKKRIRVKTGHRQNYTRLLVEQIGGSELVKKEPVKVEKVVEAQAEATAVKAKAEKTKVEKAKVQKAKQPVKAEKKADVAASKAKKPAVKAPTKKATKPVAKKSAVTKPTTTKPASKTASKKPSSSKAKTTSKKPAAK
jgi:large subunit ribosomal protein L21